jgi:hypothetical protein
MQSNGSWKDFFSQILLDERIKVWHLSLYLALVYCWDQEGRLNPVSVCRRELMRLSHIHSNPAYHKYLLDLVHFGYIQYLPSYHPQLGSWVYFNEIGHIRSGPPDI